MVQSDWGDWLVRDIEDASPDSVGIWYLGCNGFVLKGREGTTVYIDPYLGLGTPPRTIRMIPVPFDPEDVTEADAVLATHEHSDHVHGESQAPILESTDAPFYAPDDSLAVAREENWTDEWELDDDQFVDVSEGETIEIGEFTVHVETAHDPDSTQPVSYVFEHETGTIFHGGDTKPSDEFDRLGEEYDIDLGILAFGTVGMIPDKETGEPKRTRWYNDENQIIEAAESLEFERLLPSHWDMWKRLTTDPTVLHHHAKSFDHPQELAIVEIGDRIDL
ncbi:Zn-dependent hydrolase of the beta-lactamase fold-like protein [Haloterrigena turkmenica DSM 5511]|uniref:Zn-dependent hydrolase of the beta-lactamase fold-like protein n=1 Tax=Haloterrigena turkmenica (strain ATCC 51198 / DSM 5511 / JCM 9101 / NCIMB 13204 / VKM B-1734 / 4k) TaxID=543526 RepID=D2RSA9_HALTV|nr:MBL fold metallo-hydrolase [Haloterrigena turkmenica]ADB60690.1 Zn-dependent hydrolase of the beta-lactamase fold-like protein [Haloterrigena turkmenica DSM 5511]